MDFKIFYHAQVARLQEMFKTGLIFLLPVFISWGLFSFVFHLLESFLTPIKNLHIPIIDSIPYHEIILLALFILATGLLIKTFILTPFITLAEVIFDKIPLISTIYEATKKLIHAFTAHDHASFKEVVIVEFPRPGIYSIGFVTKEIPQEISPLKLYGIYIPHTPNPATGNFIMIPENQMTKTCLTRQEATALIMSGGILQPTRFTK